MFRVRLAVAALLCAGLAAMVTAQDPKQPPKADPKAPAPTPPQPAPTQPAPAGQPDPNKTRFELKVEKDKAFHQKLETKVTQVVKVQGQDLTQKQDSTFYFEWRPVKQEGDKTVLKQKVEGLEMMIDISGNPISYKSSQKDAPGAGGNPGLMDFFRNLEGSEFTVTLDKNFKVEKVDGKDEFVKKLTAGNTQVDALLKKIMTDEAMRQMADPTFNMIPDQPQGPGGTWEKKQTLNLGPIGSYEVTYKFTYKGKDEKEKDKDRVEVVTSLTYKPPTDAQEGLPFRIKGGELKSANPTPGYVLYDPKAGRVTRGEIKVKLSGSLQVVIGGAETKVELDQDQTTTIESSDKPLMPSATPATPPAAPEKK